MYLLEVEEGSRVKIRVRFEARRTPKNLWDILINGRHSKCSVNYNGSTRPRLYFSCYSCTQTFCAFWETLKWHELELMFHSDDIKFLGERNGRGRTARKGKE